MSRPRILVVDDEEDFQDILRQVLAPLGYEVSSALDGPSGLESIRRSAPDLVILDINLPLKDGYAVCRELRADPLLADLPVLMLTIRSQDDEVIRGLDCGADDYLTKPFSPEVLAAKVALLLRRA